MSKEKENDQIAANPAGFTPAAGEEKNVLSIEEHAKNLAIDAPVFQAVMQSNNWASGKRIPETVFKQAVEGFRNGSMGGN